MQSFYDKLLTSYGCLLHIDDKNFGITVTCRNYSTGNGSHWTPVNTALLLQFI